MICNLLSRFGLMLVVMFSAINARAESAETTPLKNKICPISQHEIGSMGEGVEYEHEGQIVKFCCAMCIDYFKEDPEKYLKFLEEQASPE